LLVSPISQPHSAKKSTGVREAVLRGNPGTGRASKNLRKEICPMVRELWETFVMLIPVFFLLTMIFGAGFYIGRVSKREQ